jgi:hypothetical protein
VPIHDLTTAPDESRAALARQAAQQGRVIGMYDAAEHVLSTTSSLGDRSAGPST